jgi:polyisoprenoid-binding protein YceI
MISTLTKQGERYMVRVTRMLLIAFFSTSIAFAANFNIDKVHSKVGFSVTHMVVATVTGEFNDYEVNLNFDKENLSNSDVTARIKVATIDTENERRDNHLRSDDFFNAEKYPEIIFVSNTFEKTDDGYLAHGQLTIRDVTKEVALPFIVKGPITDKWGNTRIGISAELTINRQEYGVKWNDTLDNGGLVVSDEVGIKIDAEFIQNDEQS